MTFRSAGPPSESTLFLKLESSINNLTNTLSSITHSVVYFGCFFKTSAASAESAEVFHSNYLISWEVLAERAGLEPAAFRVTGGRYNQLN